MRTTITIETEDKLPDDYDCWEDYFENYNLFLLGEDKDEVQFFIDRAMRHPSQVVIDAMEKLKTYKEER